MVENIKYRKSYYEANKQKIKENNLAYYHKMKLAKEWQNQNKESYLLRKNDRCKYNAQYYQNNKLKIREKQNDRNNKIREKQNDRNNKIRNRDMLRCGDCNILVKIIDIDKHHRMKCNSKKKKPIKEPGPKKPKKRFQDILEQAESLKIYFD